MYSTKRIIELCRLVQCSIFGDQWPVISDSLITKLIEALPAVERAPLMAWIEVRTRGGILANSHCGGIGLVPLCSQEGGKTLVSGC